MADGINLDGFTSPKVNNASVWNGEQYAADPASAFPATDVSSQGPAGTTNKMVHTAAETSAFGTGK